MNYKKQLNHLKKCKKLINNNKKKLLHFKKEINIQKKNN